MNKRRLVAVLVGLSLVMLLAVSCAQATSTPTPGGSVSNPPSGSTVQASYYPVGSSQQTGIWVSGQGKVTVTPDVAVLTLGVQTQAATVVDANQQAANAMDAVMKSLAADGVDTKDIKTSGYTIDAVTTWNKDQTQQILIGYRVSNTITVKVRVIANAGKIIDDAVKAGGDSTRFNGIYMTVDNPSQYTDQARQLAIQDAMAKAQQMATLTKVTLGKPLYITETSAPAPVPMYRSAVPSVGAADQATTPITPGQTDITVSVQIGFAIQ